ncbi:MAG: aminotransferase class I/II-fold pyridoxal phosphate-dependent enzyme, partial [Ignavibacteriaceae bacterium]|nr:aminotransferase class I/II-fold pyridoxal phosphate-dependent enzyme [Ignavibacteriaceae bacterium]
AEENQSGFFIWARIPENEKDSYTFTDRILLEANVFITPGSIFGKGGERYIRLSLCSPEQILNESLERVSKLK